MRVHPGLSFLVALSACNDNGLAVHNGAPVVSFSAPFDGAIFPAGEPVLLQARMSDDLTPREEMPVQWTSDLDGALSGILEYSDDTVDLAIGPGLAPGIHTLSVQVFDAKGRTATDAITVEAVANQPPEVAWLAPESSTAFVPEAPFAFVARVEDDFTAPEDITFALASSTTGPLTFEMSIHENTVEGTIVGGLTPEDQTLTLTAYDGGGESASVSLDVVPLRNAAPSVVMLSPAPDTVYTVDNLLISIEVADTDAFELSELTLAWSGIVDHPAIEVLEALPVHPDTDGTLSRYLAFDCDEMPDWGTPDTFVLEVQVTDLDGATASAEAEFSLMCHGG